MNVKIKSGTLMNVPEEWVIFNMAEAQEAEEVLYFHPLSDEVQPLIAFMQTRKCENCFISRVIEMTDGYVDDHVWYIDDQPRDIYPCDIYIDRA